MGKTWAVEDFGKKEYSNFVKINFEFQTQIHELFEKTIDPKAIIESISLLTDEKIDAETTLIFFDEIQACPRAITSLKYFYENAPQYHIIAAGSLLGVSVGSNANFPVGKVNFLSMYPMSFYEFLKAMNMSKIAIALRDSMQTIDGILHEKLIDLMKLFIFIGGMPEVVASYIENKDMDEVRTIQEEILNAYERDFSKYTDASQAIKTREVWNTIPYQLSRENKKFKYSDVKTKARAINYETTIEWLQSAGLVYCVNQIRAVKLPLKGYADATKFKLYSLDTGLLIAMLRTKKEIILNGDKLFSEYNGALTENFICSEIVKSGHGIPHYWVSKSEAEVDFVFEINGEVIPLEVKSGMDRNTKSIRSYQQINNAKYVFRASPRSYSKNEDGFVNIGLYGVMGVEKLVREIFV